MLSASRQEVRGACPALELGRFVVAESATGLADEYAYAGDFVGRFESLPSLECRSKRVQRVAGAAVSDGDRAVGLRDDRAQRVAVERVCQLPQLIPGSGGLLDFPHGPHDLEVRRQQGGAPQPIAGRTRQPANRRACRFRASLRQPQQRESRLRLASPFAGSVIDFLCPGKLAPEAMNLGLLIQRSGRRLAIEVPGSFAGAARFGQRIRPGSLQTQDLGAMHETGSGEDHLRLLLAHTRERGGPLACTPERMDLTAGVDDAAVHQRRHDRKQLARDDGEHRLVEALEAGRDIASLNQRTALCMTGRCREVRVAKGLADRDGLTCGRVRRVGLPFSQLLLGDGTGQVASFDAARVFDQPLASRGPGVRLGGFTAEQDHERQPERTARGTLPVAGVDMDAIEPFEDSLKLDVPAAQVRRGRQPVEIIDAERARLVCTQKCAAGLRPRAPSVALASMFKRVHLSQARSGSCTGPCS